MALNASMVWNIRVAGSALNGAGFDAAVSGAGTDYTYQDAAQLALTDLVSTASTTITSVTGGFTAAMVGNVLRLASATGTPTAGYYTIITYVDTNTITVDRVSGTYTAGVGKVGGAFAVFESLATAVGAGLTAPAITSPLAAGHTIMLQGAGSDAPGSNDYSYVGANKYMSFVSGNSTAGRVHVLGYNGRPRIGVNGLLFFTGTDYWVFENLYINIEAATVALTVFSGLGTLRNIVADQNNNDLAVCDNVLGVFDCAFINSGATPSAGSVAAIKTANFAALVYGNFIENWRGGGITFGNVMGQAFSNIISGTKSHGITVAVASEQYETAVIGNTLHNNTGDGIRVTTALSGSNARILNNIITNNGGYGINLTTGATALNDRLIRGMFDYNAFYSNTSGARNAYSAGAHDVTLTGDPYTNAAGKDFSLNSTAGAGAAAKGVALP